MELTDVGRKQDPGSTAIGAAPSRGAKRPRGHHAGPCEGRTLACPRPEAAGPRTKLCLQRLRERIDGLDEALVRLLVERARLAAVIGQTKRESGLPIHAPDREDAVLGHVTSLAAGPFGPEEIARVFRTVMAETRRTEERE